MAEPLKLPAITLDSGLFNLQDPTQMGLNILHHNVIPIKTKNEEWALAQRPTFNTYVDNSASSGYGRGIAEVNGKVLRTTEALYYYGAASSASITGDTSFHTPYMSVITHYNQSGVDWIVIQNAGSNTTNVPKGNLYYALVKTWRYEQTGSVLFPDESN